jgi:uncharacterized repeat protein (TIGR01451 family)
MKLLTQLCLSLCLCLPIASKAQWTEHFNPENGNFYSVVFLGDRFFASEHELCWSYDAHVWTKANFSIPSDELLQLQEDGGRLFAYTGLIGVNAPSFRVSLDTGKTWQTYTWTGFTKIDQLLISGNTLLRVTDKSIYRSTNFGQTWQKVLTSGAPWAKAPLLGVNALIKTSFGELAFSRDSMYKSTNDGSSWTALPLPSQPVTNNGVSVFGGSSVVLMQTTNSATFEYWRSLDEGATWEHLSNLNLPVTNCFEFQGKIYVNRLSTLDHSDDLGLTWVKDTTAPYNIASLIAGNNLTVAKTQLNGLPRQENAPFWKCGVIGSTTSLDKPNNIKLMRSNGQRILAVSNDNTYLTSDEGNSWEYVSVNTPGAQTPLAYSGNKICRYEGNAFDRSFDNGKTWERVSSPFPNTFSVNDLVVGSGDKLYAYTIFNTYSTFYRSDDWANSWTSLSTPFQNPMDLLLTHGDQMLALCSGSVFESDDNGITWTSLSTGLPPSSYVNSMGVTNEGHFFAISNNLLYHLDGAAWVNASNGLLDANNQVSFIPDNILAFGDTLFIYSKYALSANNKFYVSTNKGQDWSDISSLLKRLDASSMLPHDGQIFLSGFDVNQANRIYSTTVQDLKLFQKIGTVFNDLNASGSQNAGENGIPYSKVATLHTNFLTTSDSTGKFTIIANAQIGDSIQVIPPGKYATVTTPPYPLASGTPYPNMGIHFTPNVTDLNVDLAAATRLVSGASTDLWVTIKNVGTTNGSGTVTLNLPPGVFNIQSVNPTPISATDEVVSWSSTDLKPFAYRSFMVKANVAPSVLLGTKVSIKAQVATLAADADTTDNTKTASAEVFKSFDPNEKACELEQITTQMIQDGERLIYTVRFQNTGNFPATIVRVLDTLDNQVVIPSSVEILSASHPYTWTLRKQNILEFVFSNILLPDSLHNESASHGFVRFSVLPKASLQAGNLVQNKASIYFDYNPAVPTNTAQTKVTAINSTSVIQTIPAFDFSLTPNPGSRHFVLHFTQPLSETAVIQLTDPSGRTIWTDQKYAPGNEIALDLPNLPGGVYVVTVKSKAQSISKNLLLTQ